ncbi:MAG TPA: tetratricopeptide repeat protein [Victivallales bacterium]|nr:tetratricopeptide repeat protein [Victivallales bacterium]
MKKENIICIFVFIFTSLVFLTLGAANFVWDDFRNFVGNTAVRNMSYESLITFFSSTQYDNYFPLTWISISVDYSFWGENPFGYHLTNVLLHASASAIFFLLCGRIFSLCGIGGKKLLALSLWTSLIYSTHPMRVETVAWISTRGDLLCSIFLQLSFIYYLKHSYSNPQRTKKYFLLSCIFCLMSLFCRAWAITFPIILLLCDLCFNRFFESKRRAALEKIPFLIMSAIFAGLALSARINGMPSISELSLPYRIIISFRNFSFYISKTLIPSNLSPLYPLSNFNILTPIPIASAMISFMFSAFLILNWKRYRLLATAWFSYLLLLLPVSGLSQSGIQIAADRYSYISTMPVFVVIALFLFKLVHLGHAAPEHTFYRKTLSSFLLIMILLPLLLFPQLSYKQNFVWVNDYSLWTKVIDSGNASANAYYNRGVFLASKSSDLVQDKRNLMLNMAFDDFSQAINLSNQNENAFLNRGKASTDLGRFSEGIEDFNVVLKMKPNHQGALSNRALAFEKIGKFEDALQDLSKILSSGPDRNIQLRIATIYGKTSNYEKAENVLNEIIFHNPSFAEAYVNRGAIRLIKKDIAGAKEDFIQALIISPNMKEAEQNLLAAKEIEAKLNKPPKP